MADLSSKSARKALASRPDPYFMRLEKGCYLGFRKHLGPSTWSARYRDRKGVQHRKVLADIDEKDYDGAARAAREWFTQMGGPATRTVKRATVRAALETYLAHLSKQRRPDTAKEVLGRYKLTVYGDGVANLLLESATREDFSEWRDRLAKGRQARSINRHVRAVIAGLNYAVKQGGHVGTPAAWQMTPLADDIEDDETAVFLDAAQRKALIAAAAPHDREFFRGLELTGARPKELAMATVGDFDGLQLKLSHRKGKPPKLRTRYTVLGTDGVEFFTRQAASKHPKALLFTEDDGKQRWRRHVWAHAFRAAANEVNKQARGAARIPPEASAYSFRHARISELLQIHGVDPLTVAQQTGTSLVMIEKAYLRVMPKALQEKLQAVRA